MASKRKNRSNNITKMIPSVDQIPELSLRIDDVQITESDHIISPIEHQRLDRKDDFIRIKGGCVIILRSF